MKILICLSVLIVATATCDPVASDDNQSKSATPNHITPPEFSRVNQEVYKAYAAPMTHMATKTPNYTIPPIPRIAAIPYKSVTYDVPPTKALQLEAYSKPVALKAGPPIPVAHTTVPVVRSVINEVRPVEYRTQYYSIPRGIIQTYGGPTVRILGERKENSDPEDEPVEYQPEEYPALPIGRSYAPPVAVYNSYPPVVRRRYILPSYRTRGYSRSYNIGPASYRTLGYGGPIGYSAPLRRSLAYRYASLPARVRYDYNRPRVTYDSDEDLGEYNGFIDEEYDDILKKK